MNISSKISIMMILIYCECLSLKGQVNFSKFEIGINAGVFIYQGDLTPSRTGSYRTGKPGLGIYVNKLISPAFSLRTNLAFGKLKGDDAKYSTPEYRQQRNFNFKSPVFEISELLVADLFKNNMARQYSGLSPYLFAGIGFSFLNIKRDWSRFNGEYLIKENGTL